MWWRFGCGRVDTGWKIGGYPIMPPASAQRWSRPLGNTLVNWLDSVLYGYYSFAYVFGDFVYRAGVGVLNAAAMATIALPLVLMLRRQKSLLS